MKLSIIIAVLGSILSLNAQPGFSDVPDWAKKAVWYQIFPERFWDGDPSNNPTSVDLEGAWPYFVPEGWSTKSWTSDWYFQDEWEKNSGLNFYSNCGLRRYGGDLQGIISHLSYLQDLGINAIYLNPIFESPSLHKYDASMYHHIDNNFGPEPELDRQIWNKEDPGDPETWQWTHADKLFLKLIDEAHKRDIKIIIDGVFNHVGNTFWAFKDLVENQQSSRFKEWFTINSFDDPETEENEFDYQGWYGVKDLPEIRETEDGLDPEFESHIKAIVERWMDPNNDGNPSDGIDGWRLDVAEMVPHGFWQKFRSWVRDINTEAYTVGEVWWEDYSSNKMFNASPWLKGDQFDAVMNYRFTRAVQNFIIDEKNKISPRGFVDSLNNYYNDYRYQNVQVLMNLMGSHDTERLASLIVNPDMWYDHMGNLDANKNLKVHKPDEIGIQIQKLIVGLQMTLPGAPHIYYGDETGMWGLDDPDCRKPFVHYSKVYDDESNHPYYKKRQIDKVHFNENLYQWYKNLIRIRNENETLSLGSIEFSFIDDEQNLLGITREYKDKKILILINNNNSENEFTLRWIDPANHILTDLLTGKEINFHKNKSVNMPPYGLMILN
ncbi:MAG: glycoside hydrolase family 13 protein [Melioribacteraceae bacterium]|nr:glycoside hydrolase family 13 protein [Melioribacteraceae bacterium]